MGGKHSVSVLLFAISLIVILSCTVSAAEYTCASCQDCQDYVQNSSSGDTVRLTAELNTDSTCIAFGGADNITLDCDGHAIWGDGDTGDYGIYLITNSNNNTIMDCTNISYFNLGIYVYSSTENKITNVTANNNVFAGIEIRTSSEINVTDTNANNNGYGIYLYSGSENNTIRNIILSSNDNVGIFLDTNSNSNNITDVIAYNNGAGVRLYSSSSNTVTNVTANNGEQSGLYIHTNANNNIITDINTSNNTLYGINLQSSSGNTITNAESTENNDFDVYIYATSDSHCNNNLTNVTGSGDYPISYYNSSATLSNTILSELILCNADYSDLDNITIIGSSTEGNNGILTYLTDYSEFNDINSSNNLYGIYLRSGSNNTITNTIANNNNYGIYLYSNFNNTITNITASSNNLYGIYLQSSYNNTITNGESSDNMRFDVNFHAASESECNNNLTNVTGSGGYPISYYNSSATLSNTILSELILCNADYSDLDNITIIGSSTEGNNGIFSFLTDYSEFNDINSSNNYYGIYFRPGSNNTITNAVISNNLDYGIYFYSNSNNNTINNTVISNNSNNGIYLHSSYENTITNTVFSENTDFDIYFFATSDSHCNNNLTNVTGSGGYPISYYNSSATLSNTILSELILCNADYSDLDNITIIGSSTEGNNGIFSFLTDYSEFNDINSSNNYYGIYLRSSSNNTITNMTISNNIDYGIYTYSGINNTVYNNWLNGTCYIDTVVNYWNTTFNCSAGPNIIGGPCLGGNYWTDADGSGQSDECTDSNNDGICDSSYTPATNNVDYHPLSNTAPNITVSSPSNTSYTTDTINLISLSNWTLVSWWYQLNSNGTNETFTPGSSVGSFLQGLNNITVWLSSTLGKTNQTTIYFSVDNAGPDITISSPTNTSYSSVPINLNVTATDPGSYTYTCLYNLDGGTNYTLSNDSSTNWFTEMSPSEATYQLSVYCNDSNGNMRLNDSIWFTYYDPVRYCDSCSSCNTEISQASPGDIVTLNQSINSTGTCIDFSGKSNVILDCDGFTIWGDNSGTTDYGIYFPSGADSNTVIDCTNISYFARGISIGSSYINLTNITAVNNHVYGVWASGGLESNNYTNITAINNAQFGIYAAGCNNSVVRGLNITTSSDQGGLMWNTASSAQNDIDTSNEIDGKPVMYFDGGYNACPENQEVNYSDTYSQVTLAGCDNVTLRDTELTDGLWLWYTHNSTVYNINTSGGGYYGTYLYYSNSNNFTNLTSNYNYYGIYFYTIKENNFTDITATYNTDMGIRTVSGTDDNNLADINSSNNGNWGIYLSSSDGNVFNDTTVNSNNNDGILVITSVGNTFYDLKVSYNMLSNTAGIHFYQSTTTGNRVIGLTANNNYHAVEFYQSHDNSVTNMVANNNEYAIYLREAYNNNITNMTANNNTYGVYIYDESDNNIINDSFINGSSYGIRLYQQVEGNIITNTTVKDSSSYGVSLNHATSAYPRYNTFYNNVFNNTDNLYSSSSGNTNYWNTTLDCSGTNIIGGPCTGGNFWTNSTSDTYSDTCTDENVNGICDSTYTPESGNTDSLPLTYRNMSLICDSCSDCSSKIQGAGSGKTVYLNTSISDTDTCIDFGGTDNVIFDCQGYTIEGDNTGSGEFGFHLSGSSNNTVTSCLNISYFSAGIVIEGASENNTIKNCTVEQSSYSGILLNASGSDYPRYNIFYNNLFNNTENLLSNDTNNENYWNTTLDCSGTNILGEPCIGGNYWTNSTSDTQSDTCTDSNRNGICDSSYTPRTNNTDSLPLTHIYPDCDSCALCNSRIDSAAYGTKVYLNASIFTDETCIDFNGKDGVTLDCDGHAIWGESSGYNEVGIYLPSGSDNNTVMDCTNISYFYRGIYVRSNNNNIFNITVDKANNGDGIYVYQTGNTTFTNISVINSTGNAQGLYLSQSNNNNFTNINIINGTDDGFYFSASWNNTLRNVTINTSSNYVGLYPCLSTSLGNDIDETVYVDGRPVKFFDDHYNPCPDNQELNYGDTYSQISLCGCDNVTLNATSVTDTVYFSDTHNSRIYNVNSSYANYGIHLYDSDNNTIENVITNNNQNTGVRFYSSCVNNTLFNITSNNNVYYGFQIYADNDINNFTDITTSGNSYGMYLYRSDLNNLTNVNASYNTDGFTIYLQSYNNTLINTTAIGNTYGIHLQRQAEYNVIVNSTIRDSTTYGIYLDEQSGGYARYNTFYNNYLNNTDNFGSDNAGNINDWNTTLNCTSGNNIIGGSCIGGNYWTNPYGNDTSDTCTDLYGDGVCDSSYTPETGNTDYHPLIDSYVGIVSPLNTTYTDSPMDLNVTSAWTVDTWWYQLNTNGTNVTFSPNTTITAISGLNNITVWANKSDGSETSKLLYFTLDNSSPSITITSPLNNSYFSLPVNLNVTTSDAISTTDTCLYNLDSGTNYTLSNDSSTNWFIEMNPSEGTHQLLVYCNDSVGNTGLNSTMWFTYYSPTPGVTIYYPANQSYSATSLWLNVSANETINTWWYQLNTNGTNETFTPNVTISGFVQGTNGITVWANDSVGNENSSTIYFTIDTSPPSVDIYIPANITYSTTSIPTQVWSNETINTWWYQKNSNGTNITFTPNVTISGFAQGTNNITFWANDSVGNENSSTIYFTVDSVAPNIGMISPTNTSYTSLPINLNVTTSDATTYTHTCLYNLDSGTNTSLSNDSSTNWFIEMSPSEATHQLFVYCNDSQNNWAMNNTIYFTYDAIAPTISLTSPTNQTYSTVNVNLNVTTSDATTYTHTCLYNLDSGTNTSLSNDSSTNWFTVMTPGDGTHQVNLYCNDSAGNMGLNSTMWFSVDTSGPLITMASPLNQTYSTSTLWLNVSANETINTWWYQLNTNGTNETFSPNTTITSSIAGMNNIIVWANDSYGNENSTTIWFNIDPNPPGIVITSPTNQSYTSLPINLNVTTSDATWTDTCLYSLDSGTNYTLSNDSSTNWFIEMSPGEGTHQLFVYCNDSVGNMNLNSTVYFTYDATVPEIVIDSPLNQSYTSLPINLNLTVTDTYTDTHTCQYNLDGGSNTTLSNDSSTNWFIEMSPSEGTRQVNIYCNDSAGNMGLNSTWFTYDGSLPTLYIASPLNQSYSATSLWLNVSANETIDTWWYQKNSNGTNITFNPNVTISDFVQGTNNITFWANDSVGNENSSTIYFTIDTSPPSVDIYNPANITYSTTSIPTQVWSNETINTWWYQKNSNGTNITFNPNVTISDFVQGTNNITFWANDSVGNENSSTIYFTVDTAAPSITVDAPINQSYDSYPIYLNVTASDLTYIHTCLYNYNAGINSTMSNDSSSHWYVELNPDEGTHQLFVYCNDSVGNMGLNSTIWFTFDQTEPTITISSPLNQTYGETSIPLNVSANETINTWWYQLNSNGTNYTFTPNITIVGTEGMNNITVWANETSGKQNSTTVFFTIDTLPPNIIIDSPENQSYDSDSYPIYLNVTASDLTYIHTCLYNYNAGINSTMSNDSSSHWYVELNPDEGTHQLFVYCNDSVGNMGLNSTLWFTFDKSGPLITISSPLNQTYGETSIPLNVSANETINTWWYQLNTNGTNYTFTPNTTIVGTEGMNNITVWANDSLGNENSTTVFFEVDTSAIGITIDNPANQSYNSLPVNLNVTTNMDASTCLYNLDGGGNTTMFNDSSTNWFIEMSPSEATHQLFVYCNNTLGNFNLEYIYFTYDATAPPIQADSPLNQTYTSLPINLNVTTSDATTYTHTCLYNLDGGTNYTLSNSSSNNWFMEMNPGEGTHQLFVYCNDSAGNYGINSTMWFTYDPSAPGIVITSPANQSYTSLPINLNITATDTTSTTDSCLYNLNGGYNSTLSNDSSTNWFIEISSASEGTNQLLVYCNDSVSNMGLNSTIYFTYDGSFPAIYMESIVNQTYGTSILWLNVSANETINTWWYQLNTNGTNETFTPNVTISGFVQGTNGITVWANDSVGNENSTTIYFTVDTAAPSITVDAPVNNSNHTSLPININVTTSDATTWTHTCLYNLDSGTNTSLSNDSSTNWFTEISSASESAHWLFVYCNDSMGNVGLNSTIWFTYDATAPALYINSPANTTYSYTDIQLNVSANETINTWWYQLNTNGTNETFSPNVTITGLEGINNITIWANDTYGNEGSSTVFFTVDTSNPSVNISSPVNETINTSTGALQLNVSANETIDTWWYQLNSGENKTFTPNTTIYTTLGGLNNITIWANDSAGNMNETIVYFTVNATNPIVTITSPTSQTYTTSSVSLAVSSNVNVSTWKYQLNSGTNNSFTPNTTISSLSNAAYNLTVWATSVFNETNYSTVSFTIAVTSQDPQDPGGGSSGGSIPTINVTPSATKSWNAIYPGEDADMEINDSEIDLTGIRISVKETARSVLIKVEQLKETPSGVQVYTHAKVYNYFNIEARNMAQSTVKSAKFNFRVSKSWIEQEGINVSTVILERWFNDSWTPLVTLLLQDMETNEHYYFESDTPGFSVFRVVGEKIVTMISPGEGCNNDGVCDEGESSACSDCKVTCTEGEARCSGLFIEVCAEGDWQQAYECEYGCLDAVCTEARPIIPGLPPLESLFSLELDQEETFYLYLYTISILAVSVAIAALYLNIRRKRKEGLLRSQKTDIRKKSLKIEKELLKQEKDDRKKIDDFERGLEREPEKKPKPLKIKTPSGKVVLRRLTDAILRRKTEVREVPILPVGVADVELKKKK